MSNILWVASFASRPSKIKLSVLSSIAFSNLLIHYFHWYCNQVPKKPATCGMPRTNCHWQFGVLTQCCRAKRHPSWKCTFSSSPKFWITMPRWHACCWTQPLALSKGIPRWTGPRFGTCVLPVIADRISARTKMPRTSCIPWWLEWKCCIVLAPGFVNVCALLAVKVNSVSKLTGKHLNEIGGAPRTSYVCPLPGWAAWQRSLWPIVWLDKKMDQHLHPNQRYLQLAEPGRLLHRRGCDDATRRPQWTHHSRSYFRPWKGQAF